MSRNYFPAPKRESLEHPGGTWSTRPWTLEEARASMSAGAWFEPGKHDFESPAIAKAILGESAAERLL